MAIEISAAVAACAFVVLVVYMILTLRSARDSLCQANQTLTRMQLQLEEISRETVKLIQNTNRMTLQIQNKMKSVDLLFEAIGEAGETIRQVTASVKQVSAAIAQKWTQGAKEEVYSDSSSGGSRKLSGALEWAVQAIELWQKRQKHKTDDAVLNKIHNDKGRDDHVRS